MIAIDASLAVKLVIAEADSDAVERWYLECKEEIIAPDLIEIEVAQAVVRRVNAREISGAAGRSALSAWRLIGREEGTSLIRSSSSHVARAATIAMDIGHPVKGCLYLVHAIEHACNLITCDAQFVARASIDYPCLRLFDDLP